MTSSYLSIPSSNTETANKSSFGIHIIISLLVTILGILIYDHVPTIKSPSSNVLLPDDSTTRMEWNSSNDKRLLVVYDMNNPTLHRMALDIKSGFLLQNMTSDKVLLSNVSSTVFNDVLKADGIIIGTSIYNANVDPIVTAFMKSWDFSSDLRHMTGAAFVTAGGPASGLENGLMSVLQSLLIFRMKVIGGNDWQSAFGAFAIDNFHYNSDSSVGLGIRMASTI